MRDYRKIIERQKGKRDQIEALARAAEIREKELARQVFYCEQAQSIIQNIAQLTQQELEYHVSELATLALAAVFDDPYELSVEFIQRRNRTECDISFTRGGRKIDPLSASGGGAVDVASFALRVALWSLAPNRTRNILMLDEPLKWLKGGELPEKGAKMIAEISSRLQLQIIMVSHIPDQIESSDLVHEVLIREGISKVRSSTK